MLPIRSRVAPRFYALQRSIRLFGSRHFVRRHPLVRTARIGPRSWLDGGVIPNVRSRQFSNAVEIRLLVSIDRELKVEPSRKASTRSTDLTSWRTHVVLYNCSAIEGRLDLRRLI